MTTYFDTTFHMQGIEIVDGSIGINNGNSQDKKWEILSTDEPSLEFKFGGDLQAKIIAKKEEINPNFIGKYRCFIVESCDIDNFIGLIVSSTGNFYNTDMSQTPSIIESVPTIKLSDIPYDPKVLGIISGLENYNREYSHGLFRTILEQEDGINRIFVNSLGMGVVWVIDINGDLKNGDYITSSGIKGYGMKQDDDIKHSYTVAKVTQDCCFKPSQFILQKPVEFDINGPIYEPILNINGEYIQDYDYRIKYIDINGNNITSKQYENVIDNISMSIRDMSLTYSEKREIAIRDPHRTVFRACLVGCTYTS